MIRRLMSAFAVCLLNISPVQAQSIFTFAGGGTDDNVPATRARILRADGLAVDQRGNLYIADNDGCRIRKVDIETGIIGTLAGRAAEGFSGDGGEGSAASLQFPQGVAVDGEGNVYIADSRNDRIRRVDGRTRIIETVVGGGVGVFVSPSGERTPAFLSEPIGLTFDAAGNLLIASSGSGFAARLNVFTRELRVVAGRGSLPPESADGGLATLAFLNQPSGVAVSASGDIYLSDTGANRIRKVTAAGIISTVAGDGSSGVLNRPSHLAIHGNILYIADLFNFRLRKLDLSTGVLTTLAQTAVAGLAVSEKGEVYVGYGFDVRVLSPEGESRPFAGTANFPVGDGGLATNAQFARPRDVAVDASGNAYISDTGNQQRVRRVDAKSGVITTVMSAMRGTGEPPPLFMDAVSPAGLAIDSQGRLYISDDFRHQLKRIDFVSSKLELVAGSGQRGFSGDGGAATSATFNSIFDVAVDSFNNLFVCDFNNARIRRIDSVTGVVRTIAGTGSFTSSGDGGPATFAGVLPTGLLLVSDNELVFSESQPSSSRIRRIDLRTGLISTVAGGSSQGFSGDGGPASLANLHSPTGLTVDARGNILFSDSGNSRIRRIRQSDSVIETLYGNGTPEFSGDGGLAASAGLASPSGLATGPDGSLYEAEQLGNRVRVIPPCISVQAPTAPTAIQGQNGEVRLSWSGSSGTLRYEVRLDTINPPTRSAATDITATSFTASNLLPNTTYFWRVIAKGDPFCSPLSTAQSEVRSFTTSAGCAAPGGFTQSAPADSATAVSTSSSLSWSAAAGAGSHELHLGTTNPPLSHAVDLTSTSFTPTGLIPGTTYYWSVVARASCDLTKTTATPVRSFTVAGSCTPAGTFALTRPAAAATSTALSPTLEWTASPSVGGYDVYFGTDPNPPLMFSGVTDTKVGVSGLTPSTQYFWRVVAKTPCNAALDQPTAARSFTTRACVAPGSTAIALSPTTDVSVTQTYIVSWKEAKTIDGARDYVIQRSLDPSFSTLIDAQQTSVTFASFTAKTPGTYYHRVRAVAGCDPTLDGPNSPSITVTVIKERPSVIFTVQPKTLVTNLGEKLEDHKRKFTLENRTSEPLTVVIGRSEINSVPFFDIHDPFGGDAKLARLEPRTPKTFELRYSGPPNNTEQAYQGLIFVQAPGSPVVPYAFVSLKVGGEGDAIEPKFTINSVETNELSFPSFSGDDLTRPFIEVQVKNNGTTPMSLGPEIGPELWLVPEPGWNATPIPAGASRTIRLRTRRDRALHGSPLPRSTFFTVRNRAGLAARIRVEDHGTSAVTSGRSAPLDPGVRSTIVPHVVSRLSAGGRKLSTRLQLTNNGSSAVQTELLFTPTGVTGFDSSVRKATVVVPANDTMSLADPLVSIFSLAGDQQGQIEVRVAPAQSGQLSIGSSIRIANGSDYRIPAALRGEGARLGSRQALLGVLRNSDVQTSLTLAETTGVEGATLKLVLYDILGGKLGEQSVTVPAYGHRELADVISGMTTNANVAGRIELEVTAGGGAIVGLATVAEKTTDKGFAVVSRPTSVRQFAKTVYSVSKQTMSWVPSTSRQQKGERRFDHGPGTPLVIPYAVDGAIGTAAGRIYRTTLGFVAAPAEAATFLVTLRRNVTAALTRTVTVAAGQTTEYADAFEELFNLPAGTSTSGEILITAVDGQAYASLWSKTAAAATYSPEGSLPVIAIPSEALTGGSADQQQRPLYIDGLEQSEAVAAKRRTVLHLTEVKGAASTVVVRLYEAANRATPIAEKEITLAAFEQRALDSVFKALDLEREDRRKDRANLLLSVTATAGTGLVASTALTIDDATGDTEALLLTPSGGIAATGVTEIGPIKGEAGPAFPNGDANGDNGVSVADVFYLIGTLFTNGPQPVGPADANGDGSVSVADVFYLINFLFAGGPAPR